MLSSYYYNTIHILHLVIINLHLVLKNVRHYYFKKVYITITLHKAYTRTFPNGFNKMHLVITQQIK